MAMTIVTVRMTIPATVSYDLLSHWMNREKLGSFCRNTTMDCPKIFFYRASLALAAQQRGARTGPAYTGLAAPVGRLRPIGQALVTASSPKNRWEGRLYPDK